MNFRNWRDDCLVSHDLALCCSTHPVRIFACRCTGSERTNFRVSRLPP